MRRVLLLCVAAFVPSALWGQQRWERQVQERLARTIAAIGASQAVTKQVGMLNTEEAASFQATLVRGTPYSIIALCDDDCSLLELTLLRPDGSEIAKERRGESLPTLHFTSDTTMEYRVRVTMERCRWNPCWYAVAVIPLGKPRFSG